MSDWKQPLRLVELLDDEGNIEPRGVDKLVDAVGEAAGLSSKLKCEEFLAFATSAVRSATNSEEVLKKVEKKTGVRLEVLSGEEEARLTFLAVRRWYGWSAGRITNLDIGGGSLEMSTGTEESPDLAVSLDLGAGRLTHEWFESDPPERKKINLLRDYIDAELAGARPRVPRAGGGGAGRRHLEDVPLPRSANRRCTLLSWAFREANPHRAGPAPAHRVHLPHDRSRPCGARRHQRRPLPPDRCGCPSCRGCHASA